MKTCEICKTNHDREGTRTCGSNLCVRELLKRDATDPDTEDVAHRVGLEAAWKIGLPLGLLSVLFMLIMWILSR
jgi:hypothetical protein